MSIVAGAWWGRDSTKLPLGRWFVGRALSKCAHSVRLETTFSVIAAGLNSGANKCESVWESHGIIYAGRTTPRDASHPILSLSSARETKKAILGSSGQWLAKKVWGRYVIAIADEEGRRVCIFRDPTGLDTAYYRNDSGLLLFATDLAAFRNDTEILQLDFEFLASFLVWGSHATSRTPIQNLKELRPGELLEISEEGERVQTFWNPVDHAQKSREPYAEQELESCLLDTVPRSMDGDRGTYVDLSGGLDSSTVLAALVNKKEKFEPLVAATVFHASVASSNELAFAREVSSFLAVKLIEVDGEKYLPLSPHSLSIARQGKPTAQLLHGALHQVHSEIASELGCNAFVNGYGGDQVFQARLTEPVHLADYLIARSWTSFLRELRLTSRQLRIPYSLAVWTALTQAAKTLSRLHKSYLGRNRPPNWCSRDLWKLQNPSIFYPPFWNGLRGLAPLKTLQVLEVYDASAHVDRGFRLPNSPMHHPLLEQPLVEMGLAAPLCALVSGIHDRLVFREVAKKLLPKHIATRRTKGDYAGMYQLGVKKNLRSAQILLLEGWLARNKLICKEKLGAELSLVSQGHSPDIWPILNALALELWIQDWT